MNGTEPEIIPLRAGPYEAWVCPAMGGNVVRLARADLGVEALRTPPDIDALRAAPAVYGMPLLLPPNRIHGGAFTFDGRTYRLPVNEPSRGNFLHGFLMETPMAVARHAEHGDTATLTLAYHATAERPYSTFPHAFTVRLTLRLDANGLTQSVTVTNDSGLRMPMGLGFHTAFYIPRDRAEDFRVQVPVGREWLLDRTVIRPDGRYADDTPQRAALLGEGLRPLDAPVSNLYERAPGPVILRGAAHGTRVRYDVDDGFRFWMLWNEDARADHFCVEPMTWTVDAPNSPLPPAQSGLAGLMPRAARTLVSRVRIETVS